MQTSRVHRVNDARQSRVRVQAVRDEAVVEAGARPVGSGRLRLRVRPLLLPLLLCAVLLRPSRLRLRLRLGRGGRRVGRERVRVRHVRLVGREQPEKVRLPRVQLSREAQQRI